jgi:predicted amidohydrolase
VRQLRAVAVALHLDLACAEDLASFRAMLGAAAARHLDGDADQPTLVAFPEHVGLLGMLVGERGRTARAALAAGASTAEALLELALAHGAQLGVYASRFPAVRSPGQLLHLALTDTLVRSVHDLGAAVAAELGVWLSVGTALATDWERRQAVGDDAGLVTAGVDDGAVAVAVGPEVTNRNLVFAPDGHLATVQDKAYLVPTERDPEEGLGLVGVGLDRVAVAELPIGRVASVISKDAWMPDVNERLDQLGAQLLLQPEAFDRWAEPDREVRADGTTLADLWPPDKFRRGGWWMVQRHRSFRANVTPVLLGRLGDLRFDGQPLIAVPAPDGVGGLALLGQAPTPGWAAVGRWTDPLGTGEGDGANPVGAAPVDRGAGAASADAGRSDAGGSDAVAELTLPEPPARAALPARPEETTRSVPIADGGLQLVPDVLTFEDDVVLAWVDVGRALGQGVVTARGDGERWSAPVPVAPEPRRVHDAFDRQWRPRLAAAGGRLVVAYLGVARESWDLEAATSDDGGAGWQRAARVDDAHDDVGVLRERGHDAPTVVTIPGDGPHAGGDVVAIWSDLRWPAPLPEVRWSRSHDGSRSWGPSRPVVDASPAVAQTAPRAVAVGDDVLVAWQELVAAGGGGGAAIRLARLTGPARTATRLDLATDRCACRPQLAASGQTVWAVWEEDRPEGGGGLVVRVSGDAGRSWSPPAAVDPTRPVRGTQRAAAILAFPDGLAVVAFEDDRAGPTRILAVELGPGGPSGPVWRLCDTPDGAAARAPALARVAGGLVAVWQDTRDGREQLRSCRRSR